VTIVWWRDNPVFAQLLGLCPLLAVSTHLVHGFALGLSLLAAVVVSAVITSLGSGFIPHALRLPMLLLIAATVVSCIDIAVQAVSFSLHQALGIYLPVLAGSCLLLAMLEQTALKAGLRESVRAALVAGLGVFWPLLLLSLIRGLLGRGVVISSWDSAAASGGPLPLLAEPAGGFLLLGLLFAAGRWLEARASAPAHDCGACLPESSQS
jgi:electron transport complex protein RnfE